MRQEQVHTYMYNMSQQPLEQDEVTTRSSLTMERFLASVEKKAYHMAMFATSSHADALDLLQEAMIKLVSSYSEKDAQHWKPLFYRILQNKIRDWHRHQKVKNMVFFWKQTDEQDENQHEWYGDLAQDSSLAPEVSWHQQQLNKQIFDNIALLPEKQRQCFLLRAWEGLSVAETALAMECSEGSVKTHYSRATSKLKTLMENV